MGQAAATELHMSIFHTDCDALFLDFRIDVGQWATVDGNSTTELVLTGDHNWAVRHVLIGFVNNLYYLIY